MTWWQFWDKGGNWALFFAAFLLIEGVAIVCGHRTLSATFWAFRARTELWATLALVAGLIALAGHFKADWWR